jgi:hypothetical protein
LLGLRFDCIRLSAAWSDIAERGFDGLDRLIHAAETAGQPIVLSVGMKAVGWPEFFLPAGHLPPAGERLEVRRNRALRLATLAFVRTVVHRYRGSSVLRAWQVENEPFNRSGPSGWWIDRSFVRMEARLVRRLDDRPLMVTTFASFTDSMDRASSRFPGDRRWFRIPAEREALAVLSPNDILGLDVYRAIAGGTGESAWLAHAAPDQLASLARWRRIAVGQRKRAWVTEAQAEPWEPGGGSRPDPLTITPADLLPLARSLVERGFEAVLLWGAEYWLARSAAGDQRWLEAVGHLLESVPRPGTLFSVSAG